MFSWKKVPNIYCVEDGEDYANAKKSENVGWGVAGGNKEGLTIFADANG
jgi:hypothetical protein